MVGAERSWSCVWCSDSIQSESFPSSHRFRRKYYLVTIPCSILVYLTNFLFHDHSRFHHATAPSLIKHFRDCVKGAPRELYANILLTAGPSGQDSLVVIQMCYLGSKQDGQVYLQAFSSWDGERCLLNEVDEKCFLHQQDSVAQVLRGKGLRVFSFLFTHAHLTWL